MRTLRGKLKMEIRATPYFSEMSFLKFLSFPLALYIHSFNRWVLSSKTLCISTSSPPTHFSTPLVWLPCPPLYENCLVIITHNFHVAKPNGHFSGLIPLESQRHLKELTTLCL